MKWITSFNMWSFLPKLLLKLACCFDFTKSSVLCILLSYDRGLFVYSSLCRVYYLWIWLQVRFISFLLFHFISSSIFLPITLALSCNSAINCFLPIVNALLDPPWFSVFNCRFTSFSIYFLMSFLRSFPDSHIILCTLSILVLVSFSLLYLQIAVVSVDIFLCELFCNSPISLVQSMILFINSGLFLWSCSFSLSFIWYQSEFSIKFLISVMNRLIF